MLGWGVNSAIVGGVELGARYILATGSIRFTNMSKSDSSYAGVPAKRVREDIY